MLLGMMIQSMQPDVIQDAILLLFINQVMFCLNIMIFTERHNNRVYLLKKHGAKALLPMFVMEIKVVIFIDLTKFTIIGG